MADYIIVRPYGDIDEVLTEVSAKNIHQAIEDLDLEDGDAVTVYRIAGGARRVSVETETVRKVMIS